MNLGIADKPRRAAARRKRRLGLSLVAIGGVLGVGVVVAATLLALGVIPPSASSRHGAARRGDGPGQATVRPPRPRRPPAGRIGSYRVASTSLLVADRSRPRLGVRLLPTLVRYPLVPPGEVASGRYAKGPFPLVVFAPGYLQCRTSYAALLTAWASAGYVVAAVEFPRTHCRIASADEADLSNQPADVSAVISRLLARSARLAGPLSGLIDPAEIAVAGHSDGGDTVAAVAANTCCHDRRVRAALILSGAEWPPLGGRYFPAGTPPMLFVQGTDDTWNPPAASVDLYRADTTGIRYYLDLLGAGHFSPYEGHGAPEPLVAKVTVAFLNAYVAGQHAQVNVLLADGNVQGVAVLYRQGRLPG